MTTTAHRSTAVHAPEPEPGPSAQRPPVLARWARAVAAAWCVAYLALGILWMSGPTAYPWPRTQDNGVDLVAPLDRTMVAVGTVVLAAAGLLLLVLGPRLARRRRRAGAVLALAAFGLAASLAVVIPDMRVLALAGYLPMLLVLLVLPIGPQVPLGEVLSWPTMNLVLLTVAGLAFAVHGAAIWRAARRACQACGRGEAPRWWTRPRIDRWGRMSVTVAVVIPLGYAVTRYAWLLGIPLGLSKETLESLRPILWAGAGLATGAVVGAVLTTGLVRPWGEVFPRWLPRVGGRTVPVALAVVPASIVAVIIMSAGVMFLRLAVTGAFDVLPGGPGDIAIWLPEVFWPLWSCGLAFASWTYWLRRRPPCLVCGRRTEQVSS